MAKAARNLKFEDALTRLDEIVAAMESGAIGIEESIARYEEAMELAARCRRILEDAELRIRKIQLRSDGSLSATPLETPEDAPDAGEDDDEPGAGP